MTGTILVAPLQVLDPKQALAYPTQYSFLRQMWRTLVAYL